MAKSNLGAYQTMVELAKAADGPVKLGLYVAAGGLLVGGTAVAVLGPTVRKGAGLAFNAAKQKFAPSRAVAPRVFTISADADAGKGLWLQVGDQFTVSNEIEGGALIQVLGKEKWWMVSSHLLETISDFRIGDSEL
jgi:hypothetical protein